MFIPLLFLILIHSIISISNQEDLSIPNYSHIGCLILNSDKQFVTNEIQENSQLAYQTYFSSNMTIELCFRLCRRWIILINKNHTNCICLYTITTSYQFNEHLGQIISTNNCTSNNLEIYSLTKEFDLFPSPSSIYDWSFDGCYYLHGIQAYQANFFLTHLNYTQAIDTCRKQCQITRNTNYFSFFLSFKKSCYCLPIQLPSTVVPKAIRKPLIHCSFIPSIKTAFESLLNFSEINSDTVIKIDVQRYCSSSFIFDRTSYLCLKLILFDTFNTYSKTNTGEKCQPILINTYEQWNHLTPLSFILKSPGFIWIHQNSTYIFNDLFKSKLNSLAPNDYCIIVNRTNSNRLPTYDLAPCPTTSSSGSTLCAQKPIETIIADQADFISKDIKPQFPVNDSFSCPPEFILFNNICYYVHSSFVHNIVQAEHICSSKFVNSTLMKYDSHEWGNVNTTRFLGRSFDDILLEFFYYQLEKRLISEYQNQTNKKHWLRLLLGDRNDQNECILRYFIRSSSAFTILHRCDAGGHPVCQCQPEIFKINSTEIDTKTEVTPSIATNSSNETNIIPDEDIPNNETNTEFILSQNDNRTSKSRPLLRIISIPLLACVVLTIGTIFLILYIRRKHGSYSIRNSIIRPPITPSTDTPNPLPPAVLYTRLPTLPPSITFDGDMTLPLDNSIGIDDKIQLLPNITENRITEDEDDGMYATLKLPNEK